MLAIHLEHQGKGHSKKLIQRAENFAKEQGCNKMELSIVHVRPQLLDFYGKFGYKQTGNLLNKVCNKCRQYPLHWRGNIWAA
jgi:GNAT superfamily N-acetyltransferase